MMSEQKANGKTVWESRGRRHYGCPFRIETMTENSVLSIMWMYKKETHLWLQQEVDVWVRRFKVSVKKEMKKDFRNKYSNVYNSEKKKLLCTITDLDLRELISFALPSVVSFNDNKSCFLL